MTRWATATAAFYASAAGNAVEHRREKTVLLKADSRSAISLRNRWCEISTWFSFRNDMELALGWFDPDEEHIPVDVFTGCSLASAREGLVQQCEISDLIDLRQEPVGKRATAAAGKLPAQQLD